MSNSKPQIVLFPGAWHKPICFSLIIPKLEAAGYSVHTTQLPSVTDHDPPEDLNADIATVRSTVDEAIGSGNDVVVIPHSWAGIVVGSALTGYSKKEREAKGEKGGVVRCGYMCAFMAPIGLSLWDAIGQAPPPWWTIKSNELSFLSDSADDIFYNDLPAEQRAYWFSQCSRSHSLHTKKAKATDEAWLEIPTSYLLCEDDQAIPLDQQEFMTSMVKEKGGEIQTTRLKSSHSPFLSRPEETVDWIRRVAGEEI